MSNTPDSDTKKKADFQSLQSAYKLNGKNYLIWSQAVKTYLKGKGKLKHLTEGVPNKEDPNFHTWDETDSMIMFWLWESMEPTVSVSCMFLKTAKDVWDFIKRSYSKAKDEALTFELTVKAYSTKKGEKTITEYGNLLQSLWQELDQYQVLEMKCKDDATQWRTFQDKHRAYVFLAGLSSEYDQIRVQILGRVELPTLEEVISIVKAEESRRAVMLDSSPATIESSALVAAKKDNRWCSYCKKSSHNRDKCWKLHGKPPSRDWNNNRNSSSSQANTVVEGTNEEANGGMSASDIEKFINFFKSLEQKSAGNPSSQCSLALSGNNSFSSCFKASKTSNPTKWIIDSGATDHMTKSIREFHTYQHSKNNKIITANGSSATVAGQGTIPLSTTLSLKKVLHVPDLSTDLISLSKLTKDLNCHVTFTPSVCVIQDPNSGKRIGLAKEKNGLYHLESLADSTSHALSSTTMNNEVIWLHHFRLGHPSIYTLKHLYPELCQGIDASHFQCEVCELAKHTRVSFPISNKRSISPFQLIHSDIWGPSPLPNISGA